jgi:hypothetical protein
MSEVASLSATQAPMANVATMTIQLRYLTSAPLNALSISAFDTGIAEKVGFAPHHHRPAASKSVSQL